MRGPGPGAKEAAETRGIVLVLVSAVAYGTLPVLAKLAYGTGIRPAALLAARFAIASALFALLTRRKAPPWRERLRLWGLGLVFVTNTFTYFTALETVPAATVALLIYSYPVIVTLLAALAGLEILRLRSLVSAVLAFAGCAFTASGPVAGGSGVGFALVTAVIYAVYIVLGTRFGAGVPAETAALHVSQVCAAAYIPWALFEGRGIPADPWPWLLVVAIAVVPTVIALRTFLSGLARIGPARAAVLSSLEVVVTMALSLTLLGERLGPRQWLGAALILGAVVLQNLGALRSLAGTAAGGKGMSEDKMTQ